MFKKSDIKDIYNLTPMQEGMLFHYIMDRTSSVYFEMTVLTVSGTIDLDLFEQAFNKLIEKYDVLRTVFIHDKLKTPMQVVLKHRTGSVYFEDITGLAGEEEKERLDIVASIDCRRQGIGLAQVHAKIVPGRVHLLESKASKRRNLARLGIGMRVENLSIGDGGDEIQQVVSIADFGRRIAPDL